MRDNNPTDARIRIIQAVALLLALVFISKLYFLQVVHHGEYQDRAERQYRNTTTTLFSRGSIYAESKDGIRTALATLKTGSIVALSPTKIKDASTTYEALKGVTTLSREDFIAKATRPNDPYEEVARKVSPESAEKIETQNLPGVSLYPDRWRFYTLGTLLSHAVGFVGYKGDTLAGRYGLEAYYDAVLARNTEHQQSNLFAEIFGTLRGAVTEKDRAGDIVTTLEPVVSGELVQALQKVEKEWKSDFSGGIVMDPNTGEIFAMAALPSYDPNTYSKEKSSAVFTNPLVENVYEMGSIIKPLTMALGLDEGVVTPETTYTDKGFLELNGKKISNFDGKARGVVTMQQVLNQSLNTGVTFVALNVGRDKFAERMKGYGLGDETGIDLPNEAHGIIKNLDSGRDVETATASYGQGIALSPIETIRALASLGNGGFLPDPHIVKKIEYVDGLSKTIAPDMTNRPQVLSQKTSETITKMLVEVVDTALLKGKAKNPHWTIAAKTGTAQIANPAGGGYYEDRYLHSFFGYFPAYKPRFIVFLFTVYPKNAQYASETLTHPFMDLSEFLLHYYEIPPDR